MSVEYEVVRRRLKETIEKCGGKSEKAYVLYPFGEWGRMVKSILNIDFGIQEKAIVDNSLCNMYSEMIKDESFFEMCKNGTSIVLICSVRSEIHSELVATVASKNVHYVDLFKEESDREAEWKLEIEREENWKREICKKTLTVMDKIEKEGKKDNYYYHPQKTKALFYLPFMFSDCIQQDLFLSDDYKDIDILNFVFYEFNSGIIEKYVKGKTIIDAGANIGNHTLFFMKELGASKCYSFEPVEQTFRILKENIIINDLEGIVDYYCVGLGKAETKADVSDYNFLNIGGTGLITDEKNNDGEIEIRTIDSFAYDGDVRFIKIDVEGMELDVVKGALKLIERCRPVLMIESFEKYNYLKEIFDNFKYMDFPLGPNDYLFVPSEL